MLACHPPWIVPRLSSLRVEQLVTRVQVPVSKSFWTSPQYQFCRDGPLAESAIYAGRSLKVWCMRI